MSAIFGLAACRDRLVTLLAQARAAQDRTALEAAAEALTDFTTASRPDDPSDIAEVAAIARLDGLATRAAELLSAAAIGDAVAGIAARARALGEIEAALNHRAAANLKTARWLRLDPVRDIVDRLADTVAAAKVVAKSLDAADPDEAAVVGEIAALAQRVQALAAAADRTMRSE